MRRRLSASVFLFALLFVSFAYFDRDGANQNSRFDLLLSLTYRGTVLIDEYHENTIDKAFDGTHYYSEKAPGVAALALPAFLAAQGVRVIAGMGVSPRSWILIRWITTAGTAGLITAIGGLAAFALLKKFLKPPDAFLLTVFLFLGTIIFPYATMLFSHSIVIALLTIALWAMYASPKRPGDDVLAGVCCGFAIASEFPAAIAAGGVLFLMMRESRQRGFRLIAGAVGPLLLIPLYNLATTGNMLVLPYSQHATFFVVHDGFMGVGIPSLWVTLELLFGDYRGLFFWCPILLLAPLGYVHAKKTLRPLLMVSIVVVALTVLFVAGLPYWHGGSAIGPRYIAPVLPFLFIPAALGFKQSRTLGVVLGGISVVMMTIPTMLGPMPHENVPHPLWLYSSFRVQGMNLGMLAGIPRQLSVIPLFIAVTVLWKCGFAAAKIPPRKR